MNFSSTYNCDSTNVVQSLKVTTGCPETVIQATLTNTVASARWSDQPSDDLPYLAAAQITDKEQTEQMLPWMIQNHYLNQKDEDIPCKQIEDEFAIIRVLLFSLILLLICSLNVLFMSQYSGISLVPAMN